MTGFRPAGTDLDVNFFQVTIRSALKLRGRYFIVLVNSSIAPKFRIRMPTYPPTSADTEKHQIQRCL
ncbi:hypothetical protein FOPG_18357 [Fusarium oxysporum f. sp. conglutinans race 2 54008]|uniref:Uncharacterized protein n=1 Tax=Fusarium oxysporum f. sp. conglutinans race 2 54008 TaxID=1089457 RepID=X0HW99_FUSOX|nr:hypothetical protein FOPG_18357 [Fusarium oxysporum f. sp. conglutinans race 2 54008]